MWAHACVIILILRALWLKTADCLIRASTLKKAKSSGDLSLPLQNNALSVEPCMKDGTLVDIEDNARAFNSRNKSL